MDDLVLKRKAEAEFGNISYLNPVLQHNQNINEAIAVQSCQKPAAPQQKAQPERPDTWPK